MGKPVRLPNPAPDLLLLHIELTWRTPTVWPQFPVPEPTTSGKLPPALPAA
ncbi:plasmid pRiA4b ORF-3 family protein, partial [Pseudomonas syringae]